MKQSLLRLESVSAGYDRWPVLSNISLELHQGTVIGIVGPNAAGKSTLFRALFNSGAWLRGGVSWNGATVEHLRNGEVPHNQAVWVRQDRPIFPSLTVEECLRAVAAGATRRQRSAQIEAVVRILPEITDRRHQRMDTLSGGERALAALAVGLVNRPRLLCLDEPGANLSGAMLERLRQVVRAYVESSGAACLLVEHQGALLSGLCSSVIEISRYLDGSA